MGLWVSFFVTIILTKFLANERWITILYTLMNFLIDTVIIYILIYISDNFGHSNSSIGLGLLLAYPILALILLIGSLAGVAFSIKIEE